MAATRVELPPLGKIITGTQAGTYTVNCDGTGTFVRTLASSTGVVTTQTDDFLITQAKVEEDGQLLATALEDATRVPSALVPGGLFVFSVATLAGQTEVQLPRAAGLRGGAGFDVQLVVTHERTPRNVTCGIAKQRPLQRPPSRIAWASCGRPFMAASCQRDEGPPGGRSLVALSLSATLPCDACSTPRRLDGSPRARSA